MKKTFYLMRHGQTLFNVRKKIQGACDSPLTKTGIQQAEYVAKYFDDINLDYLYCSTAERASDTLEIVTRNRMSYTRLKGLKEMNFGVYEGESEDLHISSCFDTIYSEVGGETRKQVVDRMVSTCTEIMNKDNHNTVLAVSHGGACRSFISAIDDENPDINDGGIPNCCILKFEFEDNTFTLVDIVRHEFNF